MVISKSDRRKDLRYTPQPIAHNVTAEHFLANIQGEKLKLRKQGYVRELIREILLKPIDGGSPL
ncbi:MAG UNVERIFIED_CONTAM: hypothetical protein LVR29_17450 [Microcystis novacekii LVE1205-3]